TAVPDDAFTQRALRIDEERGGHVAYCLSFGFPCVGRRFFSASGAPPPDARARRLRASRGPQALPLYNVPVLRLLGSIPRRLRWALQRWSAAADREFH